MSTDLAALFQRLSMHYTAAHIDDIISLATKRRFGPARLLEHIAKLEDKERARRSLERRTAYSKLGSFKSIADFDWKWPEKVSRSDIEAALDLGFLHQQRNLVLVAAEGLGKTMIAKNIVHNAILEGHSALFTTAADLLLNLAAQESARALDRRLKYYARIGCLCIDELGYLSYETRNADLLFQLISLRYEKKTLLLTTNLRFSDWPSIFPGAACTTALIDRVVHHADIITIEGRSYRLRQAQEKQTTRRKKK